MSTDTPRILLVEDDERLAELTAEYLTKNDMQVAIEPRGDMAEARILEEQPDLVILDVMLPVLDGFAVLRQLRRQLRSTRGEMVLHQAPLSVKRSVEVWGVEGKPLELMQAVREALDSVTEAGEKGPAPPLQPGAGIDG